MTDLRRAAEMALEALEWSYGGEPMPTKELKAINAIRQALADQKGSERVDKLKETVETVAKKLEIISEKLEGSRVWKGMEWEYHVLQPEQYLPLRDFLDSQILALRQALAKWTPDDTAYRPDGLSQDSDQSPDATKMIDKDFALNVALETLYNFADDESVDGWKAIDAIGVVRKALTELPPVKSYCGGKPNYCEPELVGYVYQNELQGMTLGAYSCTEIYPDDSTGRIPLYTAPPKREWVSLTDEEIAQAVGSPIDEVYLSDFRKVEAKLKEKNNG